MNLTLPVNTKATVYIPSANADAITESGRVLSDAKDIKIVGADKGYTVVNLGSGTYQFVVNNFTLPPDK